MQHRKKIIATGTLATAVASALAVAAGTIPASAAGGWTATTVTGNPGDNLVLNGVFARTSTDAWAVGQQFQPAGQPSPPPVTFHWNGSSWTSVPGPALPTYGAFTAVGASSASDAWAVGFLKFPGKWGGRQALLEHWNGQAWTLDTSDAVAASTATLSGVADLSPTDAWAIAEGGGSSSLAHWNGTAWSFTSFADSGFTPSPGEAISATSASDVWVVGSSFNSTTDANVPEAQHFNGTAWRTVQLAQDGSNTSTIQAITAISPTDAWAAGEAIGATTLIGGQTLIEHWNGTAWSVVASPSPGFEPSLSGIAARSASDVIAVGSALPSENGGPLQAVILRFNGTTWSNDVVGTIGTPLAAAAAAPGAAQEWAVGDNEIFSHP